MSTAAGALGAPPRSSLKRNVTAMYALQIANYVIPLVTLPYLIRVLGAEGYGVMAMAYAVVYFMVLFVDAGFNTLATRRLAAPGLGLAGIGAIYGATQFIKLAQCVAMGLLLFALVALVPGMKAHWPVYLATFPIVLGSLFFPTWLFQGLEVMHFTTLCSVAGRVLVTAGIFLLVRGPGDLVTAALLQASATAMSGLIALPVVFGKLGVSLRMPAAGLGREIRRTLSDARALAPAEYLMNAISNSGVFVIGLFAGDAVTGVFAAVEKVARAGLSLFQPLIKALFPRIATGWIGDPAGARPGTLAWSRRIVVLALLAAVAMFALAPAGLELLFGPGWAAHGLLLQILAAWLAVAVSAAVVGEFWLVARGYASAYARCLFAGAAVQVCAAVLGAASFGAVGLVVAMLAAEAVRLGLLFHAARNAP